MRVEIALLGGFAVSLDGAEVAPELWRRRHAAALVKLLALAPRGRLHRDRVLDALWPDLTTEASLPRLHKAAHYARETLGVRESVVLRGETVSLFPGLSVHVDVAAFDAAAEAALRDRTVAPDAYDAAIALYGGELLPDDLREQWCEEPRDRLRARYERLLLAARRSQELPHAEPAQPAPAAVPAYDAPPAPRRPVTAPTLLERDDELALLLRTVRSVVRTGRGAVVLVTGEAGSGKSALTRAFVDRLDAELVVAAGGCDDLLAPRSLGPFRDMAESLPELAAAVSAHQPEEVPPALLRVLAAHPTVAIVEDVHWADDATLDAIRYVARRISGLAAILLLTFREQELDTAHPLRRVLGGLGGSSVRRIELAPLSVAAVRRLGGVDEAEATEIHRVTRGNPFFVTEVLESSGDGVPATVRDAVLARVGRLPAPARRLAERLAVVPSRAERWLAEGLAALTPLSAVEPDALVDLERSGVLTGGTDHVAFRHELARRAIDVSLTVGERVRANREVLDLLLDHGAEPARIAHHAVRAVRIEVVVEYGPRAAAEAQRDGAHRQAAELLRLVLEHADRLDHATHARLLTQRAYSLYVLNDYDGALPAARSAVAVAEESDDAVILGEALIALARIVFFARGPSDAHAAADRAVRVLKSTGDDAIMAAATIELARTHSNLATLGIVAQPSAEAVREAERAVELADRSGRDDLRAQALCYLGSARLAQGDAGGFADLEHALGMGSRAVRLETRIRAHVNAAGAAFRAGRPRDAERFVTAGLRLAADGEFAAGRYRLRMTSAAVSASSGDWDAAIGELQRLVASPGEPGVMVLLVRGLLARLHARRGDPEASDILAEALRDPVSTADSFVAGPLAAAFLELAWLRGDAPATVPPLVATALRLATDCGHTAMLGELHTYLRRAGYDEPVPADVPEPWSSSMDGAHAAATWRALGERYEEAVVLALHGPDDATRSAGRQALDDLGARATVARVTVAPPRRG